MLRARWKRKKKALNEAANILSSNQVVNSALRYRAQAPLLDSLLKEIGIDGKDISSFTKAASVSRG